MFGWGRRQRSERDRVTEEEAASGGEVVGPFDENEAPDDKLSRLDLGSVRLPVPNGSQLQVEVDPSGPVRAVHLVTQVGRLTVSAFAAPRSSGLWADIRTELAEQLGKDGARVRKEPGEWDTELVSTSPKVTLRFLGVDGPRWLLRGVAAGPSEHSEALATLLRDVVRDTIVVRGTNPLPVRTPLPIKLPKQVEAHLEQARAQQEGQAKVRDAQAAITQRRQTAR
ncbi:DUF3710 domain-containing protein [Actinoalloteichus sp. AHMU CJ021]|uniref:DUF3710 domain-containing protein n=1 Tax=Actinoalloteichus caeruleus DSM 43889 TaxID=1120930 RepID=A0ABT1JGX1_ACTCY|nr:DUF3710 domain-containing protein [Actinoalloteichus caeruleus]AUS77790.1 DUF3710 domain-containing protein [Actinoalloteichus sp. AHMU CJ021]MCP2331740.1 Protein of unknown function (DUF3710) [Actinoalloteichus caeruleus DSM 43889]